jgi:excisionase family DNA binding protein
MVFFKVLWRSFHLSKHFCVSEQSSINQAHIIVQKGFFMERKASNPDNLFELWTVKEVACFLGVSVQTIYNMTARKTIPFFKIGGAVLFIKRDLKDFRFV